MFAAPFPPLGRFLTAGPFPLSLGPAAALPLSVEQGQAKCLRWAEIRNVEARGKKVLINDERLLKVDSHVHALSLAELIKRISQSPAKERERTIGQAVRAAFDTDRMGSLWQDFASRTRTLRLVANLLFGYLFLLAPGVIWQFGFRRSWMFLLAGLLALTATIAVLFHGIHKTFYPADEDDRFTHFLILLLSPATAARACDVLSRPLLEAYHPLAVARVLCSPGRFHEVAQDFWREFKHPPPLASQQGDSLAQETQTYARTLLDSIMTDFLKRVGIEPADLLAPPAPGDETCRSYCPRCLAQFTTVTGTCADCGGLALVRFGANALSQGPGA